MDKLSLTLMRATVDKVESGTLIHYGVPVATIPLAEAATRLTHWTGGRIPVRAAGLLLQAIFAPTED